MKKNELTIDDMLLCRDMIGLVLGDSDLSKGFRQCLNTNSPKLERLQNKLDGLVVHDMIDNSQRFEEGDNTCDNENENS